MIKRIILLLITTILLASCESINSEAWNKQVVDTYNQTVGDIEEFEDMISLDKIGKPNAIKSILEKGNSISARLDAAIASITQNEIPDGAETYQTATLEMLQSMKVQISIGLQFTNITEQSAEADIDGYADKYDAASYQTATKTDSFVAAQQQFVKDKGID